MESIIFQQIRDAVDEEYITAYLDDTTGNFTCQIPDLLTYLINNYAYIPEAPKWRQRSMRQANRWIQSYKKLVMSPT